MMASIFFIASPATEVGRRSLSRARGKSYPGIKHKPCQERRAALAGLTWRGRSHAGRLMKKCADQAYKLGGRCRSCGLPQAICVAYPDAASIGGCRPTGHLTLGEAALDPLDRFLERRQARGIGEAQVALTEASEAGARERRDTGLLEEHVLQRAGIEAGTGH